MPEDIAVQCVSEAEPRFHSRLLAKEKIYQYRILTGGHKNVFERKYVYPLQETLDIKAMKKQQKNLSERMILRAFVRIKNEKSTVRTIYEIKLEEENGEIRITYRGNGFLYNMVRILTGTLIEVGRGEKMAESIDGILEAKERSSAGFTVPARGLTLSEVRY